MKISTTVTVDTAAIDAKTMPIPCPECGHETTQTFGWLKAHDEFTCRCGVRINLKEVSRAIRAFVEGLSQLGQPGG